MGLIEVPTAFIAPFTVNCRPELNLTVTPGFMVRVTAVLIVISLVMIYGDPAVVQVVFIVMFELTVVSAEANNGKADRISTESMKKMNNLLIGTTK